MSKLSVTAHVEVDDENIDDAIIRAAAAQLLEQSSLTSRYGGKIAEIIEAKLGEIVAARVEQMLDKEVTQVDRWGSVVPGPRKTFRDVFADQAEKFLQAGVTSDGRPAEGGYSSISRFEFLIRKVGLDHMTNECRHVAEAFKAGLKERATAAIAAVVAEHVKRVA